jgi:undecaprenyl-diphosphatase
MTGRRRDRAARLGRGAWRRARPYLEQRTLAVVLLVSLCGWAFAELADEMREGATGAFDRAVLLALRDPLDPSDPLGPGWVEEFVRDVTALGGVGVLAYVTFAAAGYLLLLGRAGSMLLVLTTVFGGQAASSIFKAVFDRARPDLVPHGAEVYTASFPSGHAMMSAVVYLTLGGMLARVQPRRRLKVYVLALAVATTLAVGMSRVYLGVHWPTDVLAGWAAGAAWALSCLSLAGWLQRRGLLDPAADPRA